MTGSKLWEPLASGVKSAARDRTEIPFHQGTVLSKLILWVMKGGLAMMDQGFTTGSTFVIGVLLARWLPPQQYGSYAVAFAVLLLLQMLCQALLLEPMLVFGAGIYLNCLRGYLEALLSLLFGITVVIVFVLCVSAGVVSKLGQANGLPGALLGVAFAAPLVLLSWLVKRIFYLKHSPAPAAGGAFLYCALTIGGLTLACKHGLLSPLSAFLLIGLGSLGVSVLLLTYLGLRLPSSQGAPSLRDTWHRHWRYGRWALASYAMMWLPANMFYPLLSSLSGTAKAGELKALMNFASPMQQTYAALSLLLLPWAASVQRQKDRVGASALTWRISLLCVSGAGAYWGSLLLFKAPVFRLLYSGRYTEVAYLLPVVALGSVFWCAFFGPAITLRAMESPASIFTAALVSGCISLAIGVPATWALGVRGAVWAMTLSEALTFAVAVVLLRKAWKVSDAGLVTGSSMPLQLSGPVGSLRTDACRTRR